MRLHCPAGPSETLCWTEVLPHLDSLWMRARDVKPGVPQSPTEGTARWLRKCALLWNARSIAGPVFAALRPWHVLHPLSVALGSGIECVLSRVRMLSARARRQDAWTGGTCVRDACLRVMCVHRSPRFD